MGLANVATALKQFAQALAPGPNRDALVLERDALLAAPPPAPASTLVLLETPACRCETCTRDFHEEQAARVKLAAWTSRVKTLDGQLFKLTCGDEKERDAPGEALAELRRELLQAIETNRARPWERVIVYDGRGRPIEAYETSAVLAEISMTLLALYRQAQDVLLFLSADELLKAIDETRARMNAALASPLKRSLTPDVAKRAGTEPARLEGDAARAGLRPGASPNLLEGNVTFGRR